mmetsp:Transcript_8172/g.20299  ORF Transcript_8172/g.20299 Transcript_8172/m.20299 type:complete len:202 (-) Transcript_8172:346-951(-)
MLRMPISMSRLWLHQRSRSPSCPRRRSRSCWMRSWQGFAQRRPRKRRRWRGSKSSRASHLQRSSQRLGGSRRSRRSTLLRRSAKGKKSGRPRSAPVSRLNSQRTRRSVSQGQVSRWRRLRGASPRIPTRTGRLHSAASYGTLSATFAMTPPFRILRTRPWRRRASTWTTSSRIRRRRNSAASTWKTLHSSGSLGPSPGGCR